MSCHHLRMIESFLLVMPLVSIIIIHKHVYTKSFMFSCQMQKKNYENKVLGKLAKDVRDGINATSHPTAA